MKNKIILGLILILGLGIRFYQLNNNPPSLNHHEVAIGYQAYSLSLTARDQQGNFLPLFINVYDQIRLPAYTYLTSLPVRLLGSNAFSVRLISALAGAGLIATSYLITKQITESERISLLAGFLTALSPWSLFMSRYVMETNLTAFFISLGIYFWLSRKDWLCFIFWALSLFTHLSALIIVPVLVIYSLIKLIKDKEWLNLAIGVLIALLFSAPLAQRIFFADNETISIVQSFLNQEISFFSAYLKNLNLKTIFLNRGNLYHISVPGHGLLFLTSAPFLFIGLIAALKNKLWLLIIWLLISFVPTSLWFNEPNYIFSLILLPLPMIFTALGINRVISFLKSRSKMGGKLVFIVFILAVSVEFGSWWKDYWSIYQQNYSWAWQYGYEQAVDYVKNNYSKYDQIIFTKQAGFPKQHLLFHWPWDPNFYHQVNSENFDKFIFIQDNQMAETINDNQEARKLLISGSNNYPKSGKVVKQIKNLDGSPAFNLIAYE